MKQPQVYFYIITLCNTLNGPLYQHFYYIVYDHDINIFKARWVSVTLTCWYYLCCRDFIITKTVTIARHGRIMSKLGVTSKLPCQFIEAWWCIEASENWVPWWRHQIETFSTLLAICAGNSPVADEFPSQRPVTRSFDVFFDLHLNKRLSKQSRGRWFVDADMLILSLLLWFYHGKDSHNSTTRVSLANFHVSSLKIGHAYRHRKTGFIGSINGLSPVLREAFTWSNDNLFPIEPLGTNFSEIRISIHAHTLSFIGIYLGIVADYDLLY